MPKKNHPHHSNFLIPISQANISFQIFDKAASPSSTRNWAFTLGWARPYLSSLLPEELTARLQSCQVDPYVDCASIGEDRIVLYNGATHEEAFQFPIPGAREINIRKLRELLADEGDLGVRYGKKCVGYDFIEEDQATDRVRVNFADSTSATGTLLVGVDGASSLIRRTLFSHPHSIHNPATNEILPFALMNFNVRYHAHQARWIKQRLHPLVDIAIHPLGHYIRLNILDMPDKENADTWTFQILSTWPLKNVEDYDNEDEWEVPMKERLDPESGLQKMLFKTGGRVRRLKEHIRAQKWAEPYASAIEWILDDAPIGRDQLKIWKPVPWDNQQARVTLVGDAAHAMTFRECSIVFQSDHEPQPPILSHILIIPARKHTNCAPADRGQGANNSLYDAYCLVEALKSVQAGKKTLQAAIDAYDSEVVRRGQTEVQISKAQTFFTHDWENFVKSPVITLGTKPSHGAKTEGYEGKEGKEGGTET